MKIKIEVNTCNAAPNALTYEELELYLKKN